jgi:hypothetical protein
LLPIKGKKNACLFIAAPKARKKSRHSNLHTALTNNSLNTFRGSTGCKTIALWNRFHKLGINTSQTARPFQELITGTLFSKVQIMQGMDERVFTGTVYWLRQRRKKASWLTLDFYRYP